MSSIGNLTGGSGGSITGQLDVQFIVEQIIFAKQQPIRDLETFELFYEAKKEAFQELNTKVSALESAIYNVNSGGFDSKTAAVSTEDYFTATASTSASNGVYSVIVEQLATAQSDTSDGFSTADDQELTDGKVTIKNYDGTETLGEVDFTGSTTSLNDLKNNINSLGLDVTATVINFGTEDTPDYRIQLTSDNTGEENGFTIVESGAGTLPAFANKIAAQDAKIYVNNPTDAITRSSNTISDIIPGVTLSLTGADATKTNSTSLTVASDSTNLKENIQSFVEAFNEVSDYLNAQFSYNEEKEAAGVLSGEATAVKVKQDLLTIATSRVEGIDGSDDYKSFAVIGLEMNQQGQLEINDDKLDDALENHIDSVKRILKDVGSTTHSDATYIGSTDDTTAGTYTVHVDTVAERATAVGLANIAAALGQDEVLTITSGGTDYTVNLTSGMTNTQVVAAINSEMGDNSVSVFAQVNSSNLEIVTDAYGSSQGVTVVSDIASGGGGTGIGTTDISDTGVDVAGTLGGNAASGTGRILTGTTGDTKGLKVSASTTSLADAINGDDKGDVYFTRGVGEKLRDRMSELSFPFSGLLAKNIESFENKLGNIADKIKDINRQLLSQQEILITQFTKANEALAQMTYLQSTLSNNFK
ncbi:MAG: flagellar filament capping protein FliD [bacterium]|nr:flagellar filament capping protein FliD [bacterium]